MTQQSLSSFLGLVIKGLLAGFVYILGTVLTGALFSALHIQLPQFLPPGVNPNTGSHLFLLVTPFLGLSLLPLALHISGSRLLRALTLSFLIFMCLGVTAVLEMRIFLTVFSHGGELAFLFSILPPSVVCGFALSFLLPAVQPGIPASQSLRSFFALHTPLSWASRFALAILAFAFVYFLFGMMVGPFVVPFYRAGVLGLTLPPFSVILPVLFVRSALFLLACLPFLIFWTHSRLSLILSLGFAFWFLTGLFGLLQVFYWPPVMRIAHSLETGADSFAYAAALVFLFLPRPASNASAPTLVGHPGHASS